MKKTLLAALVASSMAFAAPPAANAGKAPAAMEKGDRDDKFSPERRAEMERRVHLAMVVGMSEALQLNEAEALKLSDKLKAFQEKRRPVREGMFDAMKTLKAAADGDTTAQAQVDQAVQKVMDGRQQMAALDKEQFQTLARDLNPQKRAQLALFFAKFHAEKGGFGKHGGGGRHHRGGR